MPTAANLTVKKNDGTTDIVWTNISAAGGDKSPAVWRSATASGTQGQQPSLTMTARSNQDGTVRRVDVNAKFPSVYTNSATGQTEVRSVMTFSGSFAVPQNVAATDINEFSAQIPNLIATALTKSVIASGYAPT
jgi:hypothetical protein